MVECIRCGETDVLGIRIDRGNIGLSEVADEIVVVHAEHGGFVRHFDARGDTGLDELMGTKIVRAEHGDRFLKFLRPFT